MDTLNATSPHYIRCIKPNDHKQPAAEVPFAQRNTSPLMHQSPSTKAIVAQSFTGANVLRQLRYAGVFEAVTIRRTGFPYRMKHSDFFKRC